MGNSRSSGLGTLKFTSEPTGARVFFDNKLVGTTPTDEVPASPGRHTYMLELAGYDPFEASVDVVASTMSVRGVHFSSGTRTPAGVGLGVIQFTSTPTGGNIYVDGKPVGKTPMDVTVSAGHHTYRIECPVAGYGPIEDTIDIDEGTLYTRRVAWDVAKPDVGPH